jgi:hypothetical protein
MNDWIDVDEQLPENNQKLLMTYNDLVLEGRFVNGKFYYRSGCAHTPGYCNCEEQEGITHWMPLPKPPVEKNQSEIVKECKESGHLWTWMPKNHRACMRCGAYEAIPKHNDTEMCQQKHDTNLVQDS